jgi:flavin-dependent dehydrogenase
MPFDRSAAPAGSGRRPAKAARELGCDLADCGAAFHGVRLWSWDFRSQVDVADEELTGLLATPGKLRAALRTAAVAAGVDLQMGVSLSGLELGEEHVRASSTDGDVTTASVAVITDGADSATARQAGIVAARQDHSATQAVVASGPAAELGQALDIVLGRADGILVGVIARTSAATRVFVRTPRGVSPAEQLAALLAAGQKAGVLPDGFDPPEPAESIAGIALELDAHVGKRAVLAGAAGGFAATFSGEGGYPALRSGILAGEAIDAALGAPVTQDALTDYDRRWREDLAEYLRMPNTDLGLLLPMVFKNAQMSRRLARAFVLGQAF